MERLSVAGLAGVVLYASQPDVLAQWYQQHLGLFFSREPGSHVWWCDLPDGRAFSIQPTRQPAGSRVRHVEISWVVRDLDAFLERLGELGIAVDERQEGADGDHAWLDDPEGNRIELYQPPE